MITHDKGKLLLSRYASHYTYTCTHACEHTYTHAQTHFTKVNCIQKCSLLWIHHTSRESNNDDLNTNNIQK